MGVGGRTMTDRTDGSVSVEDRATLMKGLFSTFRNPTAHAPRVVWATSRADALDMLTLASMLHRRLDDATVR